MAIYDERDRHYQRIVDNRNLVHVNRAVSSASIKISIGGVAIGYLQNMTETNNRPATPLYEIGTVGIVEHQPQQPAYTLTVNKLAVYRINFVKMAAQAGMSNSNNTLYNAILSRLPSNDPQIDFSTLVEQAIPFDILVQEKDPVNNTTYFKTTWTDCIITTYTRTINATGALTIAENLNLVARLPKYSGSGLGLTYPPQS